MLEKGYEIMKLVVFLKSATETRHDNLKLHSLKSGLNVYFNFLKCVFFYSVKKYFFYRQFFYASAEIPEVESLIINEYISKHVCLEALPIDRPYFKNGS